MSTSIAIESPGQELAREMTLFEIDEALAALIDSAEEEAAANGGEISDELRNALADYVEAFGEKVDRIAGFLKAQQAFAELAKTEEERLHARRKAAENRAKGLKTFLGGWMTVRQCNKLKGRLNTITLAKNSVDSLVIDEGARIPDRYHRVSVQLDWDEWCFVLELLPSGPLRERLAEQAAQHRKLNRAHLQEAIAGGVELPGVRLIRGNHIRLS